MRLAETSCLDLISLFVESWADVRAFDVAAASNSSGPGWSTIIPEVTALAYRVCADSDSVESRAHSP